MIHPVPGFCGPAGPEAPTLASCKLPKGNAHKMPNMVGRPTRGKCVCSSYFRSTGTIEPYQRPGRRDGLTCTAHGMDEHRLQRVNLTAHRLSRVVMDAVGAP